MTFSYVNIEQMEYATDAAAQTAYPYITSGTQLLLHLNGGDGSSTFVDSSANGLTVTGNGGVTQVSANAYFGASCCYFDGVNDYLSFAATEYFNFGISDFTIDFWCYLIDGGHGSSSARIVETTYYGNANGFIIVCDGSGNPTKIGFGTAGSMRIYTNNTIPNNEWHHIALIRYNSVTKIYIDGVAQTQTYIDNNNYNSCTFRIGANLTGGECWKGKIDEFRVTRGIARWTSNFTPPTAEYSAEVLGQYIIVSSEKSIVNTGNFSLKAIAVATNSLNKSLIRTCNPTLNLSGKTVLRFYIQSTRTGSNIKIGFHDSGGITTEITPNVTSANTWQKVDIDISGVSDANKDAIDKIIITVVNADTDTTFYLDSFIAFADSALAVSKANGYAVLTWPEQLQVTKANGYAVLTWPEQLQVTKANGYAVLSPPGIEPLMDQVNFDTTTASVGATILDTMEYSTDTSASFFYHVDDIDSYNYNRTVLLLHFDGSNGSTNFVDSSIYNTVLTANGNAQIVTDQYKFGGSSVRFDGNLDYISFNPGDNLNFSTSIDFTIDFWIRVNSLTNTYATILSSQGWPSSGKFIMLYGSGDPRIGKIGLGGYAINTLLSNTILTTGTWYHIAFVRQGTVYYIFINGILDATYTTTYDLNFAYGGWTNIGYDSWDSGTSGSFDGWLDEFRIIKGQAFWTSNFTPLTMSYPNNPVPIYAYSSSGIKYSGNYSLKIVAQSGISLNKKISRSFETAKDLSDKTRIVGAIRASRTGSNLSIVLHNSNGGMIAVTPNITAIDTWQTFEYDISAIPNMNKNSIDSINFFVINADTDTTYYLDAIFATTVSTTGGTTPPGGTTTVYNPSIIIF
jgi:hypothetical protein